MKYGRQIPEPESFWCSGRREYVVVLRLDGFMEAEYLRIAILNVLSVRVFGIY